MRLNELQDIENKERGSNHHADLVRNIEQISTKIMSVPSGNRQSLARFVEELIYLVKNITDITRNYDKMTQMDGYRVAVGTGILNDAMKDVEASIRDLYGKLQHTNEGDQPWHKDYDLVVMKMEGVQKIVIDLMKKLRTVRKNGGFKGEYENAMDNVMMTLRKLPDAIDHMNNKIGAIILQDMQTPKQREKTGKKLRFAN